jgi:hypothetical protein
MPSDEELVLKVQVKLRHFIPVHMLAYHFESSALLKSSQTVSALHMKEGACRTVLSWELHIYAHLLTC